MNMDRNGPCPSGKGTNKAPDDVSGTTGCPLDFPVVGIGASAGGLEALQDFFSNMSAQPEAAFVVVQHLSPDHKSFMDELLSRHTAIPVEVAKDGTPVAINRIYLIPPKMNMTIRGGVLYLTEVVGRGLNLPIDIFLRSLAEDQRSNAVAVILSGTGSDGTLGMRAVKECGGMTLVQSDHDAKFDGMPRSAIATGMIDLILPAGELAKELSSFLQHPLFAHSDNSEHLMLQNQKQYNRILSILHEAKNVDFSCYKQTTIIRRLEKRISINRFNEISEYVDFLTSTPQEVETLFNEILIGVTRFFRDLPAFETLEKTVLPAIFHGHKSNSEIRVWIAGCSTGEEAYSIAILLKEYMLSNRILADVKIFATDIDEKSLKYAAIGFYPGNISADVPPKYLAKYFAPHGNGYQINADLRRMIIFAPQNVIDDPPFFKLNLITCRNFLIYITPETQQKVLASFHVGLKDDGILFLGSSESLGKMADGFDTLDSKAKIFRKRNGYKPEYVPRNPSSGSLHLNKPGLMSHNPAGRLTQDNRQLLAILEEIDNTFLPPSVVTDSNCNIIYTIRNAGNLLQMASGRMTANLLRMLPKEVSVLVSSMIRRAEKKDEIISADVTFNKRPMNVKCKRILPGDDDTAFYYISFEEIVKKKEIPQSSAINTPDLSGRYQERIDDLENEVLQQKESLQAAVEELETSNEELQASNEELVASNEELQSTNEELQSVNEELYTVNTEHVRKLEEILELNADYDNLLSNTQIGTLFLDTNLVIRKISRIASEITDILQTDAGRPLHHLSLNSLYPEFIHDVDEVNSTKQRIERELPFHDKIYLMRIVPYLVDKDTVKGIIISFVDLTESKLSMSTHLKTSPAN